MTANSERLADPRSCEPAPAPLDRFIQLIRSLNTADERVVRLLEVEDLSTAVPILDPRAGRLPSVVSSDAAHGSF